MVTTRYTQWDGSQQLKLDADKVFEKLAEYMSYTDDVRQAIAIQVGQQDPARRKIRQRNIYLGAWP